MRKSTFRSYVNMIIAFGLSMIVISIIVQNQINTTTHTFTTQGVMVEELVEVEMTIVDDILEYDNEVPDIGEDDIQLAEVNPDDYDGKIVIATADEVITMTVDDDGVKSFTNHLIG